jgi:hypothetical protein
METKIFANKEIAKQRYAICKSCEHFLPLVPVCEKCGCFMPGKVILYNSKCPIQKWTETSADQNIETIYNIEEEK